MSVGQVTLKISTVSTIELMEEFSNCYGFSTLKLLEVLVLNVRFAVVDAESSQIPSLKPRTIRPLTF